MQMEVIKEWNKIVEISGIIKGISEKNECISNALRSAGPKESNNPHRRNEANPEVE